MDNIKNMINKIIKYGQINKDIKYKLIKMEILGNLIKLVIKLYKNKIKMERNNNGLLIKIKEIII